jgi:predicted nucleic acid-binding Zn ribbon protein
MAQYSIGEALSHLLEKSKWKHRVQELRMRQEWEQMMGTTMARYTRDVSLKDKKLTIYTDVAALKQELLYSKEQLINKINAYFEETVVIDIMVK